MKSRPYLEISLASVFAALTVATIIWPMWIENLTGFEPDAGSGQLERTVVAVFAMLSVLALTAAQRDFGRAGAESAT